MADVRLLPAEEAPMAPDWTVSDWLGEKVDSLTVLRGRVVVLHTFQMLCPGCVSHGIPQAIRIHQLFAPQEVSVVGLHTVFEHHEAMNVKALKAFVHEYRIPFPIGVDQSRDTSPIPTTMATYGMRGTPSLLLIDRQGRLRCHVFGRPDDLAVGAGIGLLLAEPLPLKEGVSETSSGDGAPDASPSGGGVSAAASAVSYKGNCEGGVCRMPSGE